MAKGLVSVIITTKNEQDVLERLLKSIKMQTYRKIEIIVVDNDSSDDTVKISKKYSKYVFNKGPERSTQRNYGVKKSKGEYLLILDADMELTKDVVVQCVRIASKDKKIGGVAIPEESVAYSFWGEIKAFERSFYNEKGDAITDAARFYTRQAFEAVGGYDETITGPEDWDLPERVKENFKIGRIRSKILHHERVPNPFKLAKKKYYYALTSHRYLKRHHISTFSAKTIYFLRPVFYKNWKRLLTHPILTTAMFFMFTLEQFAGGVGYFVGKSKNL